MNVFSALSKKVAAHNLPRVLLWFRFITQSVFVEYFLMLWGINIAFSFVRMFLNIFEPFLYRVIKSSSADELFSVGQSLLYRVTASLHIPMIFSACS